MAQSSPKMRQNALFRASNLKIFPVPYPTPAGVWKVLKRLITLL